jgi:cytochrome c biogenesis protein CcmG/thiol:disulfide interchange protein DsbE
MTSDPNPSPKPPTGAPNPAVLPLAIALLVAAGGGGFVAYRLWAGHASTLTPIQYPGAVRSKPAAGESDESAPPAAKRIPDRLPDVSMPDAKGVSHKLSDWKGRPLMVNFWATWCDPCRVEIPWLIAMQNKYGPKGFTVVGIAMDEEGKSAVAPFLDKERFDVDGQKLPMNYPIVLGTDEAADKFGGILGYPSSFLISRDGKIVTKFQGLKSEDELTKAIESQL